MNCSKTILAAAVFAIAAACPGWAARPGAYLVAQFAARSGDMPQAAMAIRQALDADPGSPALRQYAFVLNLLAGSPEAVRLAPSLTENPLAQLLLAAEAARDGDWRGAELDVAELPHQAQMDAMRPLLLAWVQEAQGHADRALATLQPALEGGRGGFAAMLQAALIADAAQRGGLAQRLYADLTKAQPRPSLQFARLYASWQARGGDLAAARATIHTALQSAPDLAMCEPGLLDALPRAQPVTALQGMAGVLVDQAAAEAAANNPQAQVTAALLVHVALMLDPQMTEAYLVDSEIAMARKQFALAAADLQKIGVNDPLSPAVRLRLANIYSKAGKPEEAIHVLRVLAAQFPDQPVALMALGDALADQKHYAQAVAVYDRAVRQVPNPGESNWPMFYARGAAYERLHDWAHAEADMRQALRLSPNQPYVLNFLGYSLADRNQDLAAAREMIERALRARPNDGAIIDSLGWVMLRQGDTHEALRLLERAAELEPEDASITGHLGDAYWNAGRKIEAEDQWRRALVLKPEPDEQARIESRLKNLSR